MWRVRNTRRDATPNLDRLSAPVWYAFEAGADSASIAALICTSPRTELLEARRAPRRADGERHFALLIPANHRERIHPAWRFTCSLTETAKGPVRQGRRRSPGCRRETAWHSDRAADEHGDGSM